MRKLYFIVFPLLLLFSCTKPESFTEDLTLTIDQGVTSFSNDDCGTHSQLISSSTYTNSSWAICIFQSGGRQIESITVKRVSLLFEPDQDNEIEDLWVEYTFGGASASFGIATGIPNNDEIPKNEWQIGLVDASISDLSISNDLSIEYCKLDEDDHLNLIGESQLNILYEITYMCIE